MSDRLADLLREGGRVGAVSADLLPESASDEVAARRVREVAAGLPASWIRAANAHGPVRVRAQDKLGAFYKPSKRLVVTDTVYPGSALRGYAYHLQWAMPGLHALFREAHLRRTTYVDGSRHPLLVLKGYEDDPSVRGRDDGYALRYVGRDYEIAPGVHPDFPHGGDALEVFPGHLAAVLHDHFGEEVLDQIVRDDPEMLDLVLGVLLHYDP